jgi:MFS superfamily sulfate permease-like transporter
MADVASRTPRFDARELAGAFGDLGTFVPFVLAYLAVAKLDPGAVLLAFGVALIAAGAVFRTPMPVQPMKAIGATAAVQSSQAVSLAALQAASLVTGLLWIVLAATGLASRLARWVPRGVTIGIVLGLGIALMAEAVRMMGEQWWLAVPLLALAFALVATHGAAVMLVLLGCGVAYALWRDPRLVAALQALQPAFRLPGFTFADVSWRDLWVGAVVLALPQLPLTLGNALVATVDQNNRLFPDRPTTLRSVAVSTGLMNLWSAAAGGVPMCHGAGGMAGQVSFGARTGAAPAVLGAILVVLALFFSASVETLLRLFPAPVLGVILFLAGAQLALGICELGPRRSERFVAVTTAALCLWNVGAAFVFGLALHAGLRRGIVKL